MTGPWQVLGSARVPLQEMLGDRLPLRRQLVAVDGRQAAPAHGPARALARGAVMAGAPRSSPAALGFRRVRGPRAASCWSARRAAISSSCWRSSRRGTAARELGDAARRGRRASAGGAAVDLAHGPTNRGLGRSSATCRSRGACIRARDPDAILSTGAGVCVPFFWVGRLLGRRCVYVESLDPRSTRARSARSSSTRSPSEFFVQWPGARRGGGTATRGASCRDLRHAWDPSAALRRACSPRSARWPAPTSSSCSTAALRRRPRPRRPAPYLSFAQMSPTSSARAWSSPTPASAASSSPAARARARVVVPRLRRLGEHVDDHQAQLARALEEQGDAIVVLDVAGLRAPCGPSAAAPAVARPGPCPRGRRALDGEPLGSTVPRLGALRRGAALGDDVAAAADRVGSRSGPARAAARGRPARA